ncbi:MAG: zinc ribbon domain-containing protein, partial [Candidatus Latescibacteria bacterium]|nr:zinc ribbon domain-containing protein [Candidatus Latescibacterota bacterium]
IYNYSEGCPRIICSVADLCLVIGYAKGAKRIGFVEVSTACRDMEASGDGYHYHAFMQSQDSPVPKPEKKGTREAIAPSSGIRRESSPGKQADNRHSISKTVCASCGEPNPPGNLFCSACNHPLFRKCGNCGALIDAVTNDCPVCGADIEEAKRSLVESARRDLSRFDILEEGASLWLDAANVGLDDGEVPLIVFPKGNIVTPGPTLERMNTGGGMKKDSCNLVLTDRRLIIVAGDERLESELIRIDSCMVSDTGKFIGQRYMLILSFEGAVYRLLLPYGSKKSKTVLDLISTFVQAEMIK